MAKGILGKKIGMTQIFNEEGQAIPVTVIEAKPNVVIQKKTEETDGYNAIQIGFEDIKESKVNKPLRGHLKKAGVEPKRHLKEIRTNNIENYEVGQEIKVDIFKEGEKVDIVGTSKGKGFAGTVKRWNFSRGPMTHGSRYHRGPGSLGAGTDPARVFKGKKLPGRMGGEKVTVRNLEVVRVDPEKNVILVKGSVPGPRKGLLFLKNNE